MKMTWLAELMGVFLRSAEIVQVSQPISGKLVVLSVRYHVYIVTH